ncbi:SusC/RagA family TonB-linked outer membrane protein [Pedobacter sp. KR3-3]|uniref:SusC/RagA family TonB-linked outer membrane protein n=1 Tax=Pedobacter albus TaxID=3113905 RepID=A0ABU7I5Y1_9SPHI|nr:SusC/RagA family TonB-linked outer membrane protein [Pedobacter sp. KR3-3]MEE1944877.1 SusC/RagA family TonB-linked outer membrane protein [Pedobacter sp. KR3-3]
MKLTTILMTVFLFRLSASVHAQISLDEKNTTLVKVLQNIKKQTGTDFLYNVYSLKKAKPVSVKCTNVSLKEALELCFANQSLSYKIQDNMVIIAEQQNKRSSVLSTIKMVPLLKISGLVKDTVGVGIPNVSVQNKATSKTVSTDDKGAFAIDANIGDVLVFSSIGFEKQELTISSATALIVVLKEEKSTLAQVVVTALGIKRSTNALTYNVQQVKGEELTKVPDPSFVNSLSGKVAGLTLTHSSAPGGSTKAVLRGNKSINGNNNALYVVDGVPLPSLSGTSTSDGFQLSDSGDGIANLNPDDIDEISVLSGASASALYGGAASNGVILITTKKGKAGKATINYSSNVTFDQPFVLPKVQTSYGAADNGFNGWGAKASASSSYDPKDFFNTGKTYINALSIAGGTEKNQSYFSAAATNADGIIPNNKLDRYNFSYRNTTSFFENKLSLDANIAYTYQKSQNMPGQGQYYNPLTGVYLFPSASANFDQYKNFEVFNSARNIYVQNWPYDPSGIALQNPYWVANRNLFQTERNRIMGTVTAKYNFTSYLNLQGRARIDRTTDFGTTKLYATTIPVLTDNSNNGKYNERDALNSQTYADLLLNFVKTFNQFSLNATLGSSILNTKMRTTDIGGPLDPFKVPNFFSLYNIDPSALKINPAPYGSDPRPVYREQNQAVFFTGTLGYKNYLYLDVTARNDWNSSLPKSFFYPAVGLSAVISEMTKMPEAISFAKLRLSYAEVGNAIPSQYAYAGNPTYVISSGGISLNTGKSLGNELKPERSKSFEIGADLRFFNNKLTLTATYYNTNTYNQFFRLPAAPSTGYSYIDYNAGKVRNQGMETSLGYNATFGDFKWMPTVNFSFNRNKVVDLLNTIDPATGQQVHVTSLSLNGSSVILEGSSYGDIQVKDYLRDASGNLLLDNKGLPQYSNNLIVVGNVNPKYLLSFNNGFKYKNFSLSFLLDGRFGGNVVSNTEKVLDQFGMSQRTADTRNSGGLSFGGTDITKDYYGRISSEYTPYVYSATNIRLRELSFGYTIPAKVFNNKIQGIQLSVIGRNLWMIYNKAPFDPEVITLTGNNFQGYEDFSVPSLRSIGFSLKFTL